MGDDERKKRKAKSAIRTNLSDLSNALSDDATVFDDVVKACGTKSLITRKQSQEYTNNTARNTLDSRAGSLVHNIMTIVEFAPEQLDTFLCILYDSENLASRRVAVKIADAYGYNLPKYHDKVVAQDNEDIDGEAANPPPVIDVARNVAARQRRGQVETSQESLQRQSPPEHGNGHTLQPGTKQDTQDQVHVSPDTMKKWCKEGTVELTLTRVHMVGPPGSGKTCTQCLLLNKPPPKHNPAPSSDSHTPSDHTPTAPSDPAPSSSSSNSITNSTPIACKAVKALRVSVDNKKEKKIWKAVSRDELVERLASDLKRRKDELDRKVSQQKKPTSKGSRPQSSFSQKVPTKNEDSGGAAHDSGSVAEQNDSAEHYDSGGILKEIADLIPKAEAELSDEWVYIVDSGGQPAYQELLPLFTRAASLNVVTIDLSKGLDEEDVFTYRINGEEFKCDEKMKYSNRKFFKSVISCAGVQKPLQLKYIVKPPKHSMYFVLGTHYDKLVENYKDNAESKLAEMNEEFMLLTPHLKDFVVSNEIGKSIIFPHNTLLPAGSKEREQASKDLFEAISGRAEVSLTVRVPIRCFTFELCLESKAESKGFLTRDEAVEEGGKLYMSEAEVNEALVYLHNCTIILYYPEIKPQLVFVDPQKILDVLSHLLALTYVDDKSARSFAKDIEQNEKNTLRKKGCFQGKLLKKFTAVFTGDFQPEYFINLLQHLHIIANYGPDMYFLPSALPSYDGSFDEIITSTEIKPLHYIWQMENKDDYNPEYPVPVPQGIFSLIIVHLLKQQELKQKYKIELSSGKQYRDVFSLVFIDDGEKHQLYIINCHTHIEVHFDCEEHCPSVRDLVTKAIEKSSKDISVECNYVNAFPCPNKEKDCHCIVQKRKKRGGMITNHSSQHSSSIKISQSDNSYWCWFDEMSASPGQNSKYKTSESQGSHGSLDPDGSDLPNEVAQDNREATAITNSAPLDHNTKHQRSWCTYGTILICFSAIVFALLAVITAIMMSTTSLQCLLNRNSFMCTLEEMLSDGAGITLNNDGKKAPHVSLMSPSFSEQPLDITDLADIKLALKNSNYDVSTWRDLCLSLGLYETTLNTIERDKSDSNECFTTCLHNWLNRVDGVDSKGGATKSSLVRALENIGQKPVAEAIDSITFTEKMRN